MKKIKFLFILITALALSSCIVERPPYTKVEKVLTLKLGMTQDSVSKILDIPPYDFKSLDDSTGETVLIYKYRVTDRRTLPFFVKPKNGIKINGKYMDLAVTYSKEGRAVKYEASNSDVTEKQTKVIDINKVITLISVVAPALLVYLGLVNSTP